MKWYTTIFWKNANKPLMKDKTKMGKNIYNDKRADLHEKKFHALHYVFKYKYLVPLLQLGKKLMKKALITKIPALNHNRNIIIFDKAFEEAIVKWHTLYLRNSGDPNKRPSYKEMKRRAKDHTKLSGQSLRDMKDIMVTMYLYDTAYREFINILMHEIAHEMTDYYKDHPDKVTGHMFYTTDIYETNYYVLEKMVEYNVRLGVHDVSGEYRAFLENQKFKLKGKKKYHISNEVKLED